MEAKQIIMNYTVPPSEDDLAVMANSVMDLLPEELLEFCDELTIQIDDMPDEVVEQDLGLDDPYELLALYKSGKEISPGVERKVASADDVLILYRRPILDMWSETADDLTNLIRQVMVEELGRHFNFSDEEVEEMVERHYQGLL